MRHSQDWVVAALRGAPGRGPEVIRQVAEATGVRDAARLAALANAWDVQNPGAEDSPDYWREFKLFAIAQLTDQR